ncbi:MAG TPA: zf-HC2 domain-containing protein [Bacteroidota bacterium]|nr:zf-HC2 domain-containing protein [Bacteroidota bacterium]
MNHPDESSIELYVLGSPLGEEERARLLAHFDECPACRELYETIGQFYRDLNIELEKGRPPNFYCISLLNSLS